MSVQWLIVGGGVHGVHIAARLLGEGGVEPDQLRIVDPGTRLLERWRALSATTGMKHMRSPSVHHLDVAPSSLRRFAGRAKRHTPGLFARPYERPSLALFNEHCEHVLDAFELEKLHIQGRVVACSVECDGVRVELAEGQRVIAGRVVLAIGASEQPQWPLWAPRHDARVQHIFDRGFNGWPSSSQQTLCVVGGGISAGQVTLRLLKQGHRVHLVSRHALRVHQFDSDSGWLGPRNMTGFRRERDVNRRREIITQARHRGSMPPDVQRALSLAISQGRLSWHEGEVSGAFISDSDVTLRLNTGDVVRAGRVLLATGFTSHRPGGAWVDQLIESASLPCARCGYPIVDASLRWHPRVHVSGPLAELELGPVARNIAGARRAGDRLVDVALGGPVFDTTPGAPDPGGASHHPVRGGHPEGSAASAVAAV